MVVARVAATARARATNLLRTIQAHPPSCPCHGNPGHPHHFAAPLKRLMATPVGSRQTEYAFEMAGSRTPYHLVNYRIARRIVNSLTCVYPNV